MQLSWTWYNPDSKVHGANVGPTWVMSAPDGPHGGPVNLAIRKRTSQILFYVKKTHNGQINDESFRKTPTPGPTLASPVRLPQTVLHSTLLVHTLTHLAMLGRIHAALTCRIIASWNRYMKHDKTASILFFFLFFFLGGGTSIRGGGGRF